MTTPAKKIQGDNSKIVENHTSFENYVPISKFYNGRSIFITGGMLSSRKKIRNLKNLYFFFVAIRERLYGKGSRRKTFTFMSGN